MEHSAVKQGKYATRKEALETAVSNFPDMENGVAVAKQDDGSYAVTAVDCNLWTEDAFVKVDRNNEPKMNTLVFDWGLPIPSSYYNAPASYAVYRIKDDGNHTEWTDLNVVREFLYG